MKKRAKQDVYIRSGRKNLSRNCKKAAAERNALPQPQK